MPATADKVHVHNPAPGRHGSGHPLWHSLR